MAHRTKYALEASLKRLLLAKPLNKITIQDIADDCGISRMTFYYHFKDIYDLVEWSCTETAMAAMHGKMTYSTWHEGLLSLFRVILKNKSFVLNIYHCVSREQIEQYLCRMTQQLVMNVVEESAQNMEISQRDKQLIADFYMYAFVGILLSWISNQMTEDPAYLVERISILVQGDIRRALQRLRTDQPT
jgi:probable dihydroxyacetone kinase regulator